MSKTDSLTDSIPGRRRLLTSGAALALTAASATTWAQGVSATSPLVSTGPRVFLDYDQPALDAAYDQSVYAPNSKQVIARYGSASDETRRRLGPPRRLSYGPTSVEQLDVFTTSKPNAPVHVFIHGGAWRSGTASQYAFAAETFVNAGATYVAPDFVAVGAADGSLLPMADQVRRAVAWVYRHARTFGGDPDRVFVSGHSSGAHLAGVVLATDWQADFGLPPDTVKGVVCASGMYDLRGPRLSARSNYVKFTDEMEEALSPQRHLQTIRTPAVIAHGTYETPEFQRQAREFAAALKAAGKPVEFVVGQNYNHFEFAETFGNPYGVLGRAALAQMGLATG